MKANSINGATKAQHQPAPRTIPNVPCLKRHEIYGTYYAVKKIRGKIKTHALRSESRISITDRKLAERKLREWLDGLERGRNVPLRQWISANCSKNHRAVNAGKSPKTPMKGVKRVLKNGGELRDRRVG
jgi:hypothetical protein